MNGSSFIREHVELAHQDCRECEIVKMVALRNFRFENSMKTRSTMGEHWAEVTP